MIYCIPEKEVMGNLPVRSECIVSVNMNTCTYAWLFMEVSEVGGSNSDTSFSIHKKS